MLIFRNSVVTSQLWYRMAGGHARGVAQMFFGNLSRLLGFIQSIMQWRYPEQERCAQTAELEWILCLTKNYHDRPESLLGEDTENRNLDGRKVHFILYHSISFDFSYRALWNFSKNSFYEIFWNEFPRYELVWNVSMKWVGNGYETGMKWIWNGYEMVMK